jgi:hypothetical protein
MPGLVPGIHVLRLSRKKNVDGRDKPGHDDETLKIFFIIFVDAMFTTSFERLFTNIFDVTGANPAISCVYRACNAD